MKRELLIPKEDIARRVKELAQRIAVDHKGNEPVIVGILNGAVFFLADLVRELELPTTIDFIRASSYGSEMNTSGTIRITKDIEIPLEGRNVILVEDIVDTGLTLSRIIEYVRGRNPKSVKVCALIDKSERRDVEVQIDYCGFKVEEGFLVGYGLDFDEKYRYFNEIYVLK